MRMEEKRPIVDRSAFDKKYFDTLGTLNCPFCNRNHIPFTIVGAYSFDWTRERKCFSYLVRCQACFKTSLHHSWKELKHSLAGQSQHMFHTSEDLDAVFFHSIPSSFFVQDERIPKILRELITEAEGCWKMNFLTGASACVRKTIYEFAVIEKAKGRDYTARIKFLKRKFPVVDGTHFDALCHIKDMTSDKIHEQSWDKWDSKHIRLFLEVMRAIFHEIYVAPREKEQRSKAVSNLLEDVKKDKKSLLNNGASAGEAK